MSKSDGVKGNPNVKVQSPMTERAYKESTAGAGVQKSEKNYSEILDRAINTTAKPTSTK